MPNSEPRRIVLTGATRGLGLAMLDGFVDRGHTVIGCGRSSAAIETLRARYPAPHRFDVVDVSRNEDVAAWANRVLADGGAPDLLVNNAALMNQPRELWEVPPEEFAELMRVNVEGTFYVIRHFVGAMVQKGHGVIVNFSSTWGRSTSPEVAPYCASKFAIEGLTKSLAQELPKGMAAIALNPGIIDTDMLRICFAEGAASYPGPEAWAKKAVPKILGFGAKDNGQSASV